MFTQQTMDHIIQPNDTLYHLARRYHVSMQDIMNANPNINFNYLQVGQVIKIPVQTYFSQNALNIMNTFQMLWEQHGAWTRMVISSLVFDMPDKDFEVARLLRNPKDFAAVFKTFYGDQVANRFEELLTEHLVLAADLVNAAKAGDTQLVNKINERLYQNGSDIAMFLSQINPYFNFEEWQTMYFKHLDLVKEEALTLINKEYQKSIDVYDEMEVQILKMADMMAHGIMKQFNIT